MKNTASGNSQLFTRNRFVVKTLLFLLSRKIVEHYAFFFCEGTLIVSTFSALVFFQHDQEYGNLANYNFNTLLSFRFSSINHRNQNNVGVIYLFIYLFSYVFINFINYFSIYFHHLMLK